MGLPVRKKMRLVDYDYSKNGAYYITICTQNRLKLFGEIVVGATLCGRPNNPHKMIEKWLLELENKYKEVHIDEYIIMPDHIHFILFKAGDHIGSPLPVIINWFKTMTTNEYIRGVRSGLFDTFDNRVWQRNYYDHVIRNDEEYCRIVEYIRENPQKSCRGDPVWSPE